MPWIGQIMPCGGRKRTFGWTIPDGPWISITLQVIYCQNINTRKVLIKILPGSKGRLISKGIFNFGPILNKMNQITVYLKFLLMGVFFEE